MSIKHLIITIDEDKADYSGGIPLETPAKEVVFCEECEFFRKCCWLCAYRYERLVEVTPDHFCGYGRRRDA